VAKKSWRYVRKIQQIKKIRPAKPAKPRPKKIKWDDEVVVHRRGIPKPEEDLERRAVPKSEVFGTLPERIVYKELLKRHVYFDFQSSFMGGRLELGGVVADFILPEAKVIIRIQGEYWHTGLAAEAKDEAQRAVLEGMGFTVYDLWEDTIYDEEALERWMEDHIDIMIPSIGGRVVSGEKKEEEDVNPELIRKIEELEDRLTRLELGLERGTRDIIRNLRAEMITAGDLRADRVTIKSGENADDNGWIMDGESFRGMKGGEKTIELLSSDGTINFYGDYTRRLMKYYDNQSDYSIDSYLKMRSEIGSLGSQLILKSMDNTSGIADGMTLVLTTEKYGDLTADFIPGLKASAYHHADGVTTVNLDAITPESTPAEAAGISMYGKTEGTDYISLWVRGGDNSGHVFIAKKGSLTAWEDLYLQENNLEIRDTLDNPVVGLYHDGAGLGHVYLRGRSADPASPVDGDIWYREDDGVERFRCQHDSTIASILTSHNVVTTTQIENTDWNVTGAAPNWQDDPNLDVSITLEEESDIVCIVYVAWESDTARNASLNLRLMLDDTTNSPSTEWIGEAAADCRNAMTFCRVFTSVVAGAHTIEIQGLRYNAADTVTIVTRMVTCIAIPTGA